MSGGIPTPSTAAAVALASIAAHAEELFGPDGHDYDRQAIIGLLGNPAVREYLDALRPLGLLPRSRAEDSQTGPDT